MGDKKSCARNEGGNIGDGEGRGTGKKMTEILLSLVHLWQTACIFYITLASADWQ